VSSEGGRPGAPVRFKEVLVFSEGQNLRSWALDDANEVLFYQEKGLKEWSLPTQLLMSSDAAHLGSLLKQSGVPMVIPTRSVEAELKEMEQESLVRWKETFSWIISEKPIQSRRPQLWFEKDTFLPLRLFYSPNHDSRIYEVSFENFRKDSSFPRSTDLRSAGGKTLLTSQVLESTPLVDATKNFRGVSHGWTPAGDAASAELKDLIRLYYEGLR
jgi:hypothetical protein